MESQGHRIDDLARAVATTSDRRRVLKGLGGLAAGSFGFLAFAAADVGADDDDRCNRRCLRRCRRGNGDDCRERCCDD